MVTRWSPVAIKQLQKAYKYIKKHSLQNAEKVRNEIVAVTTSLGQHAERFPPDKYKQNNEESIGLLNYIVTGYRIKS